MNQFFLCQMASFLLFAFLLGGLQVESAPMADQIIDLPGMDRKPTFRQYSGYLHVSENIYLHYWFVESQNDPSNCPVVLWLNGGPGCSSLEGLLTEHGPFQIHTDGKTLKHNPYSWNLLANVLYLESPAGVGFSYSKNKEDYRTSDSKVARNNYLALIDFFRLFPEYSKNELFLTGESYGGFYIPALAELVMKNASMNLKGLAIGNGITSYEYDTNSLMYFSYYHGLFGANIWTALQENCCENGKCNFFESTNLFCIINIYRANKAVRDSKLNIYNLYGLCEDETREEIRYMRKLTATNRLKKYSFKIPEQNGRTAPNRLRAANFQNPNYKGVPCLNSTATTTFLNNPRVRKALHIPEDLPQWEVCNEEVFRNFDREISSIAEQYLKLLSTKKYRILLYNGDVDMACNFLGIEWFVDSLQQELQGKRRAWTYKERNSTQIGGYVKEFANMTVLTVKGSGHMVPTDNPKLAFIIFHNFLENQPY
ncbi:lysosomal protective protein [Microcaecilia unicolor]|uniref:Carboxypeptidase n=1 Tax=Microcaecilia unicolor TaxID=1415580 RepID=A0A6P7YSD0_9AMPH|nr:lysosomal protective protein-like [Microcaecilia unicolor]